MTVYVDQLREWGWRIRGRFAASCHMVADTPEELHAMAKACLLERRWAQVSGTGNLHYDLTASRRARAVALGAMELGRREFVNKLRELRGAPLLPPHDQPRHEGSEADEADSQ